MEMTSIFRKTDDEHRRHLFGQAMSLSVKLNWRLAASAIIAVAATQTPAQGVAKTRPPVSRQITFNGVGTHSCGVYIENTKNLQAETYKIAYQQWGAGFMAGVSNEGHGSNPYTDLATYTAWLDKWCADDPASTVLLGTVALGKRLSSGK